MSHTFKIHNPSTIAWKLRAVERRCNCTVTEISPPLIKPGAAAEAIVRYRAPASNADDRRSVVLRFRETEAPTVTLTVQARIRHPITVLPASVEVLPIPPDTQVERAIEVFNFSDSDWESLSVTGQESWLATECAAVPVHRESEESTQPRQIWRLALRGDTTKLSYGKHRTSLRIAAVGPEVSFVAHLPVAIAVEAPIEVVPQQLFFGTVAAGTRISRTLVVKLASTAVPMGITAIDVQHDLGDELQLEWAKTGGRYWMLRVTVAPNRGERLLKGKLTIRVSALRFPALNVPITALIDERESTR